VNECPGGSIIASADRDEKIQICNFPNTASIEAFCPGHSSVITSESFCLFTFAK
jgi:hypothetical protein